MAEFNRDSLDIMDEVTSPLQKALDNRMALERDAAKLELNRRTQVGDQNIRRQQQLADANLKREQFLADANRVRGQQVEDRDLKREQTVEDRDLARSQVVEDASTKRQQFEKDRTYGEKREDFLTADTRTYDKKVLDDQRRYDKTVLGEQRTFEKTKADDAKKEREDETRSGLFATKKRINALGIDIGVTEEEIQNAKGSSLEDLRFRFKQQENEYVLELKGIRALEDEVRKVMKPKDQQLLFDSASDALGTEITNINELMDLSKQELVSILADYKTDKEIQTNPGARSQFAKLMQQQEDIYNASGIQDLMFSRDSRLREGNVAAFKAIADSVDMLADLQAAGMNDDDISDIRANLKANNIQGAFERAGEEATSAIVDAYTKWGATSEKAETLKMQVSIMEAKAKMDALPTVQRGIDNLTKQFPWLWTLAPQEYLSNDQLKYAATKAQQLGITGGDTVQFGPMSDRPVFSTQALPNQLPVNQSGARGIGPGVDPSIVKDIGAGTASPSAALPDVDVEGGLPSDEKLAVASDYLGSDFRMGSSIPFASTPASPDELVSEAERRIENKIADLKGNTRGTGLSSKGKFNDKGEFEIVPWLSVNRSGEGRTRKLSLAELEERRKEVNDIQNEITDLEDKLKILKGSSNRKAGFVKP